MANYEEKVNELSTYWVRIKAQKKLKENTTKPLKTKNGRKTQGNKTEQNKPSLSDVQEGTREKKKGVKNERDK